MPTEIQPDEPTNARPVPARQAAFRLKLWPAVGIALAAVGLLALYAGRDLISSRGIAALAIFAATYLVIAIGFWEHFRIGAPLTLFTIVIGVLWLGRL